jgi:hypothetical protein
MVNAIFFIGVVLNLNPLNLNGGQINNLSKIVDVANEYKLDALELTSISYINTNLDSTKSGELFNIDCNEYAEEFRQKLGIVNCVNAMKNIKMNVIAYSYILHNYKNRCNTYNQVMCYSKVFGNQQALKLISTMNIFRMHYLNMNNVRDYGIVDTMNRNAF